LPPPAVDKDIVVLKVLLANDHVMIHVDNQYRGIVHCTPLDAEINYHSGVNGLGSFPVVSGYLSWVEAFEQSGVQAFFHTVGKFHAHQKIRIRSRVG
jgi:hypothetical protein